jgi:UrcA family protein
MNTITPFPRVSALIAAAIVYAAASSFATVCTAADSNEFPSTVVKFADLNLSTPQGATALYSRINWAARDVCKSYDVKTGRFERPSNSNPCVRKAVGDAVAKVGAPQLTAVYNAKRPQPRPIEVASTQTR